MINPPLFRARRQVIKGLVALACFTMALLPLRANPAGESVVAGNASFDRSGNTLRVTTGNRTIINWQDFSIAGGELTKFIQPSASSATLNRVIGGNLTSIYGSLESNGRIYLINPNGILIGPGGRINTAGFLASTLDTANAGFLIDGDLKFTGASKASVVNQGTISVVGGDVFLIGRQVENSGAIRATGGTVGLAAGEEIVLAQQGDERVFVKPSLSGAAAGTGISNSGRIEAIRAELKATGNLYALAINNGGTIRATGAVRQGGRVLLAASGGKILNTGRIIAKNGNGSGGKIKVDAGAGGEVISSGVIDASGAVKGTQGGEVQLLGDDVGLIGSAIVDVSGDAGGGQALIGGDFHGTNPLVPNSLQVYAGAGTLINADALSSGDGGKVVFWSDKATRFYGTVSAQGGQATGKGGQVEISSKGNLAFQGKVLLAAPHGAAGSLLLDPANITIVDSVIPNDDAKLSDLGNGATGTLFATDNLLDYTIESSALESILNGSIVLQAQNNITVQADLNLVNLKDNPLSPQRFVLQAGNNIEIDGSITTGGGDIYLEANSQWAAGHAPTPLPGHGVLTINAPLSTNGGGYIQLTAASFVINSTIDSGKNRSTRISTSESAPLNLQPMYIGTPGPAGVSLTGASIDQLLSTYQVWVGRAWSAGADGMGGGYGVGAVENIASALTVNQATTLHSRGSVGFYSDSDITLTQALTTLGATTFDGNLVFSGAGSFNNTSGGLTLGSSDPAFPGIWLGDIDPGNPLALGGLHISSTDLLKIKTSRLTLNAGGAASNIYVNNVTSSIAIVTLMAGNGLGSPDAVDFQYHPSTFKTLSVYAEGGVNVNANLTVQTGALAIYADRFGEGLGSFSSTADVTLGQALNLLIDAADVNIGGKLSTPGTAGSVTLQPSTAGESIGIGGVAGDFSISQADLQNASNSGAIVQSNLTIGRLNGLHTITVDPTVAFYEPLVLRGTTFNDSIGSAGTPVNQTVTLLNGSPMNLGASIFTNNKKITIQGLANLTGNITLDSGNAGAGNMIYFSSTLDDAAGTHNLTLDAGTGNIWVVGAIGATSPLHNLVAHAKNITLSTTTLSNHLDLTSDGTLTLYGAFTVGTLATPGSANFTTTTPGYSISLVRANHFYGSVTLSPTGSGNASLTNLNATVLGTTTIGGSLMVTSNGNISQAGPLTIGGLATFRASNYNIDLTDPLNSFNLLSLYGKNVTVKENGDTLLSTTTITGAFALDSEGSITQNSVTRLTVIGNASLDSNSAIALGYSTFAGTLSLNAVGNITQGAGTLVTAMGNGTLVSNAAVTLGAATFKKALSITAATGISQTAGNQLLVVGNPAFITDSTVNLPNLNNYIVGAISLSGKTVVGTGNVALANSVATKFGISTISGDLSLTSKGAVTQTGALTVTGVFSAPSVGAVTLTNVNNSFATLGDISRSGGFSLMDKGGGLTLAGTISGPNNTDVTLVTTGGILTIAGPNRLAVTGHLITLASDTGFVNNAGAYALDESGWAGWWRIYAPTPASVTAGGLDGSSETGIPFTNPLTPPKIYKTNSVFLYQ